MQFKKVFKVTVKSLHCFFFSLITFTIHIAIKENLEAASTHPPIQVKV